MDERTVSEQAYKKGYEQGKQDAQKWIPVTERLPDTQVEVLTYSECNGVRSACLLAADDKTAMWYLCRTDKLSIAVTHWMELPTPPTTCHMTSKQQPPKGE